MKTVAFLCNITTLRYGEVSIYDYAHYNETILGNKSIIIAHEYHRNNTNQNNDMKQLYEKFNNRFDIHYFSSKDDICQIVTNNKITHLFTINSRIADDLSLNHHECNHTNLFVFDSEPVDTVCSPIEDPANPELYKKFHLTSHFIDLPETNENLRSELSIPENAVVFGQYGNKDSFSIFFVRDRIQNIIKERDDIYFLFMNTYPFIERNIHR
jgi:hypothetical protein